MKKKDLLRTIKEVNVIQDNLLSKELINMFEKYNDTDIRIAILKKLSSVKGNEYISFFDKIINGNYAEKVRKEATSAMGRRRDIDIALEYLLKYLNDENPEIILQSLRGLLVFKKDSEIKNEIEKLFNTTSNEIIRNIISNEFKLETLDFDSRKSHVEVNDLYKNKVVNGDVLDVLKEVEKNSFHLTFTSPPYYNARDYSTYKSYDEYLLFLKKVFKEVHRVTKDGRFLIVNTSPVIISRVGRKYSSKRYPIPYDLHAILVNDGWEFVDDIHWVKPDASVKNRIGGFLQFRKPLMYKPNSITEQVMVYRKKSHKLIDWNIKCYDEEIVERSKVRGEFERNNVWKIDPVFDKIHSAVFPYKLCEKIIKYYSFEGDLVFDPFAGSGTLAQACVENHRNIFMTEVSDTYFDRIRDKLSEYIEIDFIDTDKFIRRELDE